LAFQLDEWAHTPCPELLCFVEKGFHTEWFLSFEHEVGGAADFVSQD